MKRGKKPKKILFLSRLYKPHIGGVETHIEKISHLLVKEKLEVTIICEQHDKKLKTSEKINGINILRLPINLSEKNKKFQIWKWIIKNRNFLKEFDVIHIHDVFFWIIPLIFFLDRKKIFITFHGYESYPIKFSSKIQKKVAAKYCSGSISVGKFINKWYGIASNAVIYGGVDKSKIRHTEPTNQNSAVFFGRLDSQTGILEYYKAFLYLMKKNKNFLFKVIGEGEYGKKLKRVNISPFKSDISTDIKSSHFIFVSRYLSMLEAMHEKRLVIAVYTDPIKKSYLLNSPFAKYVEICSSHKEIADKVDFYINNPKEELIKIDAAYNWVIHQTWQKVLATYLELWNRATNLDDKK